MGMNFEAAMMSFVRRQNEDVFVLPYPEVSLWYVVEEATELKRVYDKLTGSNHLRRQKAAPSPDAEMEEYGDLLGMVLTYGEQRGLDHEQALHHFINKIVERSRVARSDAALLDVEPDVSEHPPTPHSREDCSEGSQDSVLDPART